MSRIFSTPGKAGNVTVCPKPFPMEEYEALLDASQAFPSVKEKHVYLFSKGGFTDSVKERAAREGATLVERNDLFHLE